MPLSVSISFDLTEYRFPRDAVVIIEAYGQSRNVRVTLGAVGDGLITLSTDLPQLSNTDGFHFRVKVIPAPPSEPRLLGLAEGIAPYTDGEAPARSLLAVRVVELGEVVWRVIYERPGPVLEVNRSLIAGTAYLRQAHFVALAQIEVLRQILFEALWRGGEEEGADSESWQTRWIRLGERLAGRPCDSDGDITDEHRDWIRDACEAFAQQRGALTTLNLAETES